jgi:hypothetical protein
MANVEGARAEIQKAVSFFVTRFGSQAEVFEHLTRALAYLEESSPSVVAAVKAEPMPAEAAATPELEPEPADEVLEIIEPPEPTPVSTNGTRKVVRRRRRK